MNSLNKKDLLELVDFILSSLNNPKYGIFVGIKNFLLTPDSKLKKYDYIEMYNQIINSNERYENEYSDFFKEFENYLIYTLKNKFGKHYDLSKLNEFINKIKSLGKNYKILIPYLEGIKYQLENNQLVGMIDYFEFNTVTQEINSYLKLINKTQKKNWLQFTKNDKFYKELVKIIKQTQSTKK